MNNLFGLDTPIMKLLTKVADMMILSLLWIVFSIPIITTGAATTALYSVQLRIIHGLDDSIVKHFWNSFRKDFVKSTILFIIALVFAGIILLDILVILDLVPGLPFITKVVAALMCMILLMCLEYLFPLTAQFQNTILGTVKNAFAMGLIYLPYSIGSIVVQWIPVFVMFLINMEVGLAVIVYCLVGVGMAANLKMRVLSCVFRKYIPEEHEEDQICEI